MTEEKTYEETTSEGREVQVPFALTDGKTEVFCLICSYCGHRRFLLNKKIPVIGCANCFTIAMLSIDIDENTLNSILEAEGPGGTVH